MADSEQVREVERTESPDGSITRERTSVESNSSAKSGFKAAQVVWYITGLIEVLLGIRFVLKLLGANPSSGFVDFMYSVSGIFAAPFEGIFSTTTANGVETTSVFEPAIIVAMIVYALLAWGIVKLIALIANK